MRSNTKSKMLWMFSALMALGGACAVMWSLFDDFNADDAHARDTAVAPRSALFAPADSVDQFAHIWQRDVRKALNGSDAKVEPVAAAPNTAAVSMSLKLVGTAVDSQRRCAIFTDSEQKPLICTAGQTAEGVKVISIETKSVAVEFQGQRLDLMVPDQFDTPPQAPLIPDVAPIPATSPVLMPPEPPSGAKGAPG